MSSGAQVGRPVAPPPGERGAPERRPDGEVDPHEGLWRREEGQEAALHMPAETWVVEPAWMATGFALWSEILPADWDFFLPQPVTGYGDFHQKVATATDVCCISR